MVLGDQQRCRGEGIDLEWGGHVQHRKNKGLSLEITGYKRLHI